MTIYDKFDDVILEVAVDDESHRYREICGEQYVRLQFSLAEHKDIPVGSYIVIDSERYTLLDPQNIKMQHTREYEYVVIFDAEQSKLKLYKFYNVVDKRLQFPLTAKPHEHLQMLVDVLALRDGAWTMGDCIEGEEVAISYNHLSCYEALELMAQTLNTEWEVVGNTISLHKVGYNQLSPLALSYGEGKGFVSGVSRTNYGDNKPLAVVYAQGGERNIDPSKYGSSTLLLPKSKTIKYDGSKFEGEVGYNATKAVEYVSNTYGTAVGRFIPNGNIAEGSVDCTEIYPKRESEVTEVVVADATKNLYDIVDSTIPDSLNFEDYRIEGERMFVAFQSGMLAGKEFVAIYKHTAIGFNKARRFEIEPQAIDGQTMPGGAYIPAAGDKYAVFGIALPDAYIADDTTKTGASWDMMRKAVKHLAENERPQYTFSGTLDKIWAKRNWESIAPYMRCGAYIAFTNEAYQPTPMDVRIENIKDYINNPHAPELGLSDKSVKATMRLGTMLSDSKLAIANNTTRNNARKDNIITANTLTKVASDRETYKLEHKAVLAERETIDGEFADFLATYQQLYTADDEVCYDADGKALYVRGENELWDRYIVAYNAYDNELKATIQSTGVVEPTEAYTASQLEYYTAKVALLKAISTEQKAQISDLDYLKQAFGADNVADSDGVTLSRMMSVKDGKGNVVAGMYGGGVENLDSIGYDDPEHGTMMIFAGATSAQTARNAKYRVYEDGTAYIKEGIFEGITKHRVVDITKTNIDSILPPTETTIGGYTRYRMSPMLMSAIMNITNEYVSLNNIYFTDSDSITFVMPVLYGYTLYDADSIANTAELRGLVGTRFIVYNNTPALVHFCGKRYNSDDKTFSNTDTCYDAWKVGEGQFATAECKLELDGSNREVIYWDIKVGRHRQIVLPADEE